MPRRVHVSLAGVVAGAALLGACSSSGSDITLDSTTTPSTVPVPTSSTLPAAEVGPAVRAFLAGKGKSLIEFQRVSDEILDQPMPIERCKHYSTQVLPKIATTPDSLRILAREIPDPRTAYLMDQDVGYKNMFLLICNDDKDIPQRGADYLHKVHTELLRRLAGFGVTV